jgi:hypothetical protein
LKKYKVFFNFYLLQALWGLMMPKRIKRKSTDMIFLLGIGLSQYLHIRYLA